MVEKKQDEFLKEFGQISTNFPYLVASEDTSGSVVGYAYANTWNPRDAYKRTVASTVYLNPDHLGNGIGSMLYEQLFDILKNNGTHVIIGGISLPNDSSVRLHEKFGFIKIAHFKEVGWKFNKWIDVGYWELMFD